jgi:hypothetical protein
MPQWPLPSGSTAAGAGVGWRVSWAKLGYLTFKCLSALAASCLNRLYQPGWAGGTRRGMTILGPLFVLLMGRIFIVQ